MSRRVRLLVLLALAGVVGALGWGISAGLTRQRTVQAHTQRLPAFTAHSLAGQARRFVPGAQPTVLVYFDPDCDHCQRQATELVQQADQLAPAQVLWVSTAAPPALRQFVRNYGLDSSQVVRLAPPVARQTFGFVSAPDILVYRADGTLARRFHGEASAAAIRRHF